MSKEIFLVEVALADSDFFREWKPGQSLAFDENDTSLVVKASDELHAAEAAFGIGNRMGVDMTGRKWPSYVRSLSVGDVVLVSSWKNAAKAFAVAPLGWTEVDVSDVRAVLEEGRPALVRLHAAKD